MDKLLSLHIALKLGRTHPSYHVTGYVIIVFHAREVRGQIKMALAAAAMKRANVSFLVSFVALLEDRPFVDIMLGHV